MSLKKNCFTHWGILLVSLFSWSSASALDSGGIISPSSYQVVEGNEISGGDIESLVDVDQDRVCILFENSNPIQVEFEAYLFSDSPETLSFAHTSFLFFGFALNSPEPEMFNWDEGVFEHVGLNTELSVEDFVEPISGRVLARITWQRPPVVDMPVVCIDQVKWTTENISRVDSIDVIQGSLSSGTIDDLHHADDNQIVLSTQTKIEAVFDATLCGVAPENPGELRLGFEGASDVRGVEQTTYLYNWHGHRFEAVDVRQIPFLEENFELDLTETIYKYVNPRDGSLRIKVEWDRRGASFLTPWSVAIDHVYLFSQESDEGVGESFFQLQDDRIQALLNDLTVAPNSNEAKLIFPMPSIATYPAINDSFWARDFDFFGSSWIRPCGGNPGECDENFELDEFFGGEFGSEFRSRDRQLTLVTPRVFVTAWHFYGNLSVGDTHIWTGSDGVHHARTTTRVARIGSTDILIGLLDESLPGTVQPYRVSADNKIRNLPSNAKVVVGAVVDNPTRLNSGIGANNQPKILLRQMTGYRIDDQPNMNHRVGHNLLDTNQYPSEILIPGDSSRPIFFIGPNDELILVGTHHTAASAPILGGYVDEMNSAIRELLESEGLTHHGLQDEIQVYDLRTPIQNP